MTNILIAEDSPMQQLMIQAACKSIFVEANTILCNGAQDAIEAYREFYAQSNTTPDLVITDLNMPMKSGSSPVDQAGLVVTRVIHRIHAHVPIVVLSSHDSQDLIERAMGAGAVIFIRKSEFRKHRDIEKRFRRILPMEVFQLSG